MNNSTPLRQIYVLLIVVAAAGIAGRILSANRVAEPYLARNKTDPEDGRGVWPEKRPAPSPMFSSNDVSRWCTIRALVENGTYIIGQRDLSNLDAKTRDTGVTFEPGWGGVDKVMDPATGKFYSSKPTLFPTLLAGEYWLLYHVFGLTFEKNLFTVVRIMLFTVNLVPLIFYWLALSHLVERFGETDWGKLFGMAAACFGTFLSTFSTSLNNHTIAACTAMYAIYFGVKAWESIPAKPTSGEVWRDIFLAGLFAALTAAVELPALSFLVGLGALLLWRAPRQTLIAFTPPVALVLAGSVFTNYLAIGKLTPAYAEFGAKSEWYLYEGSHWLAGLKKERGGIDFAWKKEGRAEYLFHFLLGHHGIFLLSPIWLMSMAGMFVILRRIVRDQHRPEPPQEPSTVDESSDESSPGGESNKANPSLLARLAENPLAIIAVLTAYLTVVLVGFYLVISNNYGGNTSGPRWLFWLTPFWLLTMLPIVDRLSTRRGGRILALAFLAVSVASVTFPAWNPWRQPWLYQWLDSQGMIPY
jgi:hypothetical protein